MSCNTNKVCLQVKRVFDACINRYTLTNQTLTVTFPEGDTPATFVSLTNSSNGDIANLTVTPVTTSCCSRITYSVAVPVTVTALDAAGNTITGTATVTLLQDTVLKVPGGSVFSTNVENIVKLAGRIGTFDTTTLTANVCVVMLTKVVADVEIFVPAYGYLNPRNCVSYSDDVCRVFNNLPLFPDVT